MAFSVSVRVQVITGFSNWNFETEGKGTETCL